LYVKSLEYRYIEIRLFVSLDVSKHCFVDSRPQHYFFWITWIFLLLNRQNRIPTISVLSQVFLMEFLPDSYNSNSLCCRNSCKHWDKCKKHWYRKATDFHLIQYMNNSATMASHQVSIGILSLYWKHDHQTQ
jgi:hypothetical protein